MKNLILIPILLPTEDASELAFDREMTKLNYWGRPYMGDGWPHHLYLCSDLRINEGEWCLHLHSKTLCKWDKDCYDQNQYTKIEFTTDPKVWKPGKDGMKGSSAHIIDGNTKAIIETQDTYRKEEGGKLFKYLKEVNFLTEFCNRYNHISDVGKKVDMEKLAEEYSDKLNERVSEYFTNRAKIIGMGEQGFIDGFKACQSLQSNAGSYSLEDMKKCFDAARESKYVENTFRSELGWENDCEDRYEEFENYLQSITKPEPKGDIVIECEMELNYENRQLSEDAIYTPKLNDGQPILIFR